MGETLSPVIPGFNRSLRVEARADRLTGDLGVVVVREILERSGTVSWMTARMKDPRSKVDVTHELASLIRTSVLFAAQGWRDHDDDMLDARLRAGNVGTAESAFDAVLDVVDRARQTFCDVAILRIDAGFPSAAVLAGLDAHGIYYVSRLRANPVLDRLAEPLMQRPPGRRATVPVGELRRRSGDGSALGLELVQVPLNRPGMKARPLAQARHGCAAAARGVPNSERVKGSGAQIGRLRFPAPSPKWSSAYAWRTSRAARS